MKAFMEARKEIKKLTEKAIKKLYGLDFQFKF